MYVIKKIQMIMMILLISSSSVNTWLKPYITRNVTNIRHQNTVIEIIEETTCSDALVRLTCRTFKSFIYVIEAIYQPNYTNACLYNWESWYEHKSHFSRIKDLQMKKPFIIRSKDDEEEENQYDFRKTLNRRYVH